jgi:hypothetical protein
MGFDSWPLRLDIVLSILGGIVLPRFLAGSNYLRQVRAQAEQNRQQRSDEHLEQVFRAHAVDGRLSKDRLKAAIGSLSVSLDIKTEDFDAVFIGMDTDKNGSIDLEEFKAAVRIPSTVEAWAKTIPWWRPIADCMPVRRGTNSLRAVAEMTAEEVAYVAEVVRDEICRMLGEQVAALRDAFKKMDAKAKDSEGLASSKFQTFKASTGGAKEYYHGLTGRVGEWSILDLMFSRLSQARCPSRWVLTRYYHQPFFGGVNQVPLSQGTRTQGSLKP